MVGFSDEFVQHLIRDILNLISVQLFNEPRQHLLLIVEISIIEGRNLQRYVRRAQMAVTLLEPATASPFDVR